MDEREKTIDSVGNVIPRPYGPSRWSSPRVRICRHDDCENAAVKLEISDSINHAHNCCNQHQEE